ncbi:tyrosine-type recombinase/integrase [Rhizorhabdus dicambivorans]|uniref:Integrase n=1 Tax=Rhizorhabdus dicambivorans TaxID=1850238 RepID=A0A2A4G3M1_9SPHN|nr:site-specific integrase [Rhizorhabdus dicambivorans]ATE65137.1 integrase [Rhizorhabdus dicambivorans]PCE44410.1 integrase [Rhizorhabdus dicambivorans]
MAELLTKNAIEALIARAAREKAQLELRDQREPGLRLRAGARSAVWLLVIRLNNGKRSRVKLGTWPGMAISDARAAAHTVRSQIVQGIDPNAEKQAAAKEAAAEARRRVSIKDVLDTYERLVLTGHRRGAATRRALDGKAGLLTTLANRTPASITRLELGDLVKKHARKAPISANRKLAYASAFFNWCADEGVLAANPLEKMRKPAKENERDRYHTLDELREIWNAAGTLGYPFEQLYRLLIVLPHRREEVAALPVADLTLGDDDAPDQGIWLLSAPRTKNASALRVPLSPLARSIIVEAMTHQDRPQDSRYLFTTTGDTPVSGFTKAKRRLDKAIHAARVKAAEERGGEEKVEPMPHWTVHDFRTTFNTHACELLGVPPHVADRVLNHVATATRSKVMRIYNRSELFEPRREALCAWAEMLHERLGVPRPRNEGVKVSQVAS